MRLRIGRIQFSSPPCRTGSADDYSPDVGNEDEPEDYWLEGGVIPLNSGAENGFQQEVDRVIDLLGMDELWLLWWRQVSVAPVLEIQIIVLKAGRDPFSQLERIGADERVVRGRKRHLVRLHIDFAKLEALEPDERRLQALPSVLEGISRAKDALKLFGEHPPVPDSVRPDPLSAGTLRRRRLQELRGFTNAPQPQDCFPDADERDARTPTARSVLRPAAPRATPSPAVSPPAPVDGQLVLEIHIPLTGNGGVLPGEPEYEFGWIDDIEEYLEDESSDGSFDIYDEGEDFGATYIFFVSGAAEEVLLTVARNVAVLPGIPSGAFAVVTDDQSEEMGTGRRIALS
jgi:hypothetical protein